jgi:hypothetical protein
LIRESANENRIVVSLLSNRVYGTVHACEFCFMLIFFVAFRCSHSLIDWVNPTNLLQSLDTHIYLLGEMRCVLHSLHSISLATSAFY